MDTCSCGILVMMDSKQTSGGLRLLLAAQMADAGLAMMRQTFKRQHPDEADPEIEARLAAWLRSRAADGDGVAGTWPRARQ